MIFIAGFVMLWLYICHILTLRIKENVVFNLLYSWSRNVTSIYFIQWIIIIWGTALLGIKDKHLHWVFITYDILSNHYSLYKQDTACRTEKTGFKMSDANTAKCFEPIWSEAFCRYSLILKKAVV